jgi:hypothetical protein
MCNSLLNINTYLQINCLTFANMTSWHRYYQTILLRNIFILQAAYTCISITIYKSFFTISIKTKSQEFIFVLIYIYIMDIKSYIFNYFIFRISYDIILYIINIHRKEYFDQINQFIQLTYRNDHPFV